AGDRERLGLPARMASVVPGRRRSGSGWAALGWTAPERGTTSNQGPTRRKTVATDAMARQADRKVRRSDTLSWAVRAGLVGYGLVHRRVAYTAAQLVVGQHAGSATGKGALAQLAGNTAGRVTLAVLAAGFAALVVWQLVSAIIGYRDQEGLRRHV